MIPILFDHYETEFTSNGICRLPDCITCKVTEVLNGQFELSFVYPITGRHYEDIQEDCIIYATHDDSRIPQPFDIYKRSAPMNGRVTFNARHISYRLSKVILRPFAAETCIAAIAGLKTNSINDNPFEFITDKTGVKNFAVVHPVSVRSALGNDKGAILDVYGGEYEWDKFLVRHKERRGRVTDIELRYGKNLQDIKYDLDAGDTGTAVVPYWYSEKEGLSMLQDGIVVASGREAVVEDYERALLLDLSDKFEEKPSEAQLRSESLKFLQTSKIPKENITVKFYELWNSEEYQKYSQLQRLYLGDTAKVVYTDLGINITVRVVKKVYDTLQEMYESMELGQIRNSFGTELSEAFKDLLQDFAPSKTAMQRAIDHATALIRGGLGGHVVIGVNADDQPNEILIMDTDSIDTAVNVLRINMNGIGFSSTGYEGPFTSAWTLDGSFVADFITTGNLNASLLTVGIITDAYNNNSWNLETGRLVTNNASLGGIEVNSSGISGTNFSVNSGGTFNFGDASQYIRFVRSGQSGYALEAQMDSLTLKGTNSQGQTEYKTFDGDDIEGAAATATNYLYWNENTGLVVSETGTASGTQEKPYNTQILAGGINFRKESTILASMTGNALTFYRGNSGNPGFSVDAQELVFYLPDGETEAATVSANGLEVVMGKIGGIIIDDDSIYSEDHNTLASTSPGFYFKDDGHFSVAADANQYIRLVDTPNSQQIGDMTLELKINKLTVLGTDEDGDPAYNNIDGDAAKTATNYLYYDDTNGLIVSETGTADGNSSYPFNTQVLAGSINFRNRTRNRISIDTNSLKFYRGNTDKLGLQITENEINMYRRYNGEDVSVMKLDDTSLTFWKKTTGDLIATIGADGLVVSEGNIGGFTVDTTEFVSNEYAKGNTTYKMHIRAPASYSTNVFEIESSAVGNIPFTVSATGDVSCHTLTVNGGDGIPSINIPESGTGSLHIGALQVNQSYVTIDNPGTSTGDDCVLAVGTFGDTYTIKRASTSSSKRYKNHVMYMTSEYARELLKVKPVIFRYKKGYLTEGDEFEGKEIPGLYAEDVEERIPSGVYHKNGKVESWKTEKLLPVMLKLIEDQQEEIDMLKKEIAEIKAMLMKAS